MIDNDDDLANKNRELNPTRKLLFVRKLRKNWKNVKIFSRVSVGSQYKYLVLPGLPRYVTTNRNIFDFNIVLLS